MGTEPLTPEELIQIRRHVQKYTKADNVKGARVVLWTVLMVAASVAALPLANQYFTGWSYVAAAVLCTTFRGLTLVRCFVLFHELSHESVFEKKAVNNFIGRIVGGITNNCYDTYREYHVDHHQWVGGTKGALDQDYQGTIFWTTKQWATWSFSQKMWLRISRDPIVYYLVTSFYIGVFKGIIQCFVPRWKPGGKADLSLGVTPTKWRWLAVGDLVLGSLLFGPSYGIYALASAQMATAIGFAILHLHHAVEGPSYYGAERDGYNTVKATIEGCTLIDFPPWIHWLTLNVAYHHIHHMNPRVPCYNLPRCHDELDPRLWRNVQVFNLKRTLAALLLVQYNPEKKTLEPFAEYRWLYRLLT